MHPPQSPLSSRRPLNDHFIGIVDNLLERQLSNHSEQDAQTQVLLQSLPIASFAILLFISISGWFTLHDIGTTIIKLSAAFSFLLLHFNLKHLNETQTGYIICTIFAFFSIAYLVTPYGEFILDWSMFIPIVCIIILGRHRGLFCSAIYIAVIFLHGLYGLYIDDHGWWNSTRLVSYTLSMLLLSVVSYLTNFFFAHSQKKLHALSVTDPMTGLFNRRHIDNFLHLELSNAHKNNTPLSLAMIDTDDFKQINDNWGHIEGDNTLKTIASILQKSLRSSDIIGRLGGDEFIVLLPHTDIETASLCMERIRKKIEDTTFNHNTPITISIGLSCTAGELPKDPKSLIELADQALYKAKNDSKNKIVLNAVT